MEMWNFSLHWTQEKINFHCLYTSPCISLFQIKTPQAFIDKNIWQMTLIWEWWMLCHLFINLTEWHKRQMTCQQLIGNKKTKQNRKTPKKVIIILHRCSCSFSKVTTVYINNRMQLSEKQLQVQSLPSTLHKLTKSPQSNLLVKHIKIDYGKIPSPSFITSWGYYEQTK